MFLLAPVLKGFISYADLKNGAIDLKDILVLNDLIYIESENSKRLQDAQQ